MDIQSNDYYSKNMGTQKIIKGYKLFLDKGGVYTSLVKENPMEFKEGEEYFESGSMSVGKNSFCFGTSNDLDILAFAGPDAKIAVGVITIYPPYFLYDDEYRDCYKLGFSQHIKIDRIMEFKEVCEYLSQSAHYAKHLIQVHNVDRSLLKELIDKYAYDHNFYCDVRYSGQVRNDEKMLEYLEQKHTEAEFSRKYRTF